MRKKAAWTILALGLGAGVMAPAPSAQASGSCWIESRCSGHELADYECCGCYGCCEQISCAYASC